MTAFCFISCKQTDHKKDSDQREIDSLSHQNAYADLQFNDQILSEIKTYYQKEYSTDLEGNNTKCETEVSDSIYHITYRHVPTRQDPTDYFLIAIYIPTKDKNLIYGDLNGDQRQDLVVAVGTEGGGTGGNGISWRDLFVFLQQKDELVFSGVTRDYDLTDCTDGYFYPQKIDGGYLIGQSICYKTEDPRCCPSLKYDTKVKWVQNQLVLERQNKKK